MYTNERSAYFADVCNECWQEEKGEVVEEGSSLENLEAEKMSDGSLHALDWLTFEAMTHGQSDNFSFGNRR